MKLWKYSRILSTKVVSWYVWIQKILEKMKPKKKKKKDKKISMKYKCPLNDINTAEVPQTSSHIWHETHTLLLVTQWLVLPRYM